VPERNARSLYENRLGREYWSSRLARRVKPDLDANPMIFRAHVWRALCDWSWGIELRTPYHRRFLWVIRRLSRSRYRGSHAPTNHGPRAESTSEAGPLPDNKEGRREGHD
jgi:hypothetical protein